MANGANAHEQCARLTAFYTSNILLHFAHFRQLLTLPTTFDTSDNFRHAGSISAAYPLGRLFYVRGLKRKGRREMQFPRGHVALAGRIKKRRR